MSAALDCHQLRHYSDFETGSESGISDLSYVPPYQPKRLTKRNKLETSTIQKVPKRGARATRRQNNEAFLNSLSVIAETDLEEAAKIAWPDSISHCSAFKKLFEDQSIRAVWDMFITLSEAEQSRLLDSFYNRSYAEHSDLELTEFNEDYSDGDGPDPSKRVKRRGSNKSGSRRSRRGAHRKSNGFNGQEGDKTIPIGGFMAALMATDHLVGTRVNGGTTGDDLHSETEESLSRRFASILSKEHNPLPIGGRRNHNRRIRRGVTPLDLCLIHRVESELRRWFNPLQSSDGMDDQLSLRDSPGRWTPTISLLNASPLSDSTDLLCLDAFERLLVHSVANYLGLCSYSTWSDKLGQRQLWVEERVGQTFSPPRRTFVNLIESKLTT